MKISLSNGERFVLSSYEKAVVDYKGDKTNAIILHLENTTLDEVKAAFSNEDSLNTIYIYSDTNERSDFNGYQVRKSIVVGDEDGEFEVTLVEATDISLKVAAMAKNMETITQVFNQAISAFNQMEAASLKYADAAADAITKASNAEDMTSKAVSYSEELVGKLESSYGTIQAFTNELVSVKEYFKEVINESRRIHSEYTEISRGIDSIHENTANINNVASTMNTEFKSRIATLDSIENINRTIREGVNSAKTDMENTKERVEKFTENMDKLDKSMKEAIDNAAKAVNTTGEVEKLAKDLVERVTVLEPVNDFTVMPFEDAKKYRIKESQIALSEWFQTHYAYFLHNGTVHPYSITSEKQIYLQVMIFTATMAAEKGIDYQPSWNASGEPCTYDWTVEELHQLAMTIESIVRPRISKQQYYERDIVAASTMEELQQINFNYDECETHVSGDNNSTYPSNEDLSDNDVDARDILNEGLKWLESEEITSTED